MTETLIMLGSGGHAKVLLEALKQQGLAVAGILTATQEQHGTLLAGIPVLGNDDVLADYPPERTRLVNGVGSVGLPQLRERIFTELSRRGYSFATVIHPAAVVAEDALLEEGAQVMAGAVIQPGSRIGRNSIINTRAAVDHDCSIGDHVHLAPGVTLSGGVTIGTGTHVGTGATVIQGITIGSAAIVGAGALVIRNVPDEIKVLGVPAREVQHERLARHLVNS